VWAALYAVMGYAAYRSWSTADTAFDVNKAALAKVNLRLSDKKLNL